jgi:hypothetical protein
MIHLLRIEGNHTAGQALSIYIACTCRLMQMACGSQCCSCSVGTEPQFYKDEYGIRYLKTDKGNPVAVTADKRGNIMMVDQAGNLYYDAGSPQLGIYMVRAHAACMHYHYYTKPVSTDRAAHCVRESECTRQAVLDKLPYAGTFSSAELIHAKQMHFAT